MFSDYNRLERLRVYIIEHYRLMLLTARPVPQIEKNGLVSLWFGEHKPGGIEATLFINTGSVENATNRLLACLCFFRWDGKEFTPVPLIEGRDTLKYIVLGNIEEAHIEVNPD